MAIDRGDYERLQTSRRGTVAVDAKERFVRHLLQQARKTSGGLLGSESWDWYCSLLDAKILEAAKNSDLLADALRSPGILDAAELSQVKARFLQAEALLEGLRFARNLPKTIMESATDDK